MSLAVMAVRLAVKAALAPFFAANVVPAWPTLAEDRIFDSRMDLLDGRGGERTPLIVFAVEAFEGNAFSEQDGATASNRGFDGVARLVLSAQVTSRQTFVDSDTNEQFDAEAADLLDHELADRLAILQEQAWTVLNQDPVFKRVVKRVRKLDAEPYPATETGEKLAVLANSFYLEPLSDGEKALAIVRAGLPSGSPVVARADYAIAQLDVTRDQLASAALARSGLLSAQPFAVDLLAQGTVPAPALAPVSTNPDVVVTLDPQEPIP